MKNSLSLPLTPPLPFLNKLTQWQALPYTGLSPLQHSWQAQSYMLWLWVNLPDAIISLQFTEVCFNIFRKKEKVQHDQETQTDLVPILPPAPVMWTWTFYPFQDSVSLSVKWRKLYQSTYFKNILCKKSVVIRDTVRLFKFSKLFYAIAEW